LFFYYESVIIRDLHSFPTRRSSDLVKVVRFYINSEKREEFYMKDGKRHGACTMWHVNGKKKTECNYFEDVYDGEYTEWFDDGNKDRKSTRLNSSHVKISYAVFCLKK